MLKVVSACTCWHRCDHLDLLRVKMKYTDIFAVLKNYIWNTHWYFCQITAHTEQSSNCKKAAASCWSAAFFFCDLVFKSIILMVLYTSLWQRTHTKEKKNTQKLNVQLKLQHFSITHWPPQNCIRYMRRQNQLAAQKYFSKDVKPLWRLEMDSIFFEVTYLPRALFLFLSVYWHM